MSDWLDDAADRTTLERERLIEAAQARVHADQGPLAPTCIVCGDDIPAERRQASPRATRCVACQARSEHRRRR